ncbi:MAG: hypothetical protein ACKO1L_09720, partial [Brachymonas sp.]
PSAKQQHRNSVQDRILSVSTSRCNVFKTYLRRQQSDVNFNLGAATTAAGVLGAVLPGATASRNLAGTAGLFSGLQAEFNSSYYSNLAAHVIVQGIELHQQRLLATLVKERQTKTVAEYSMEAAIRDAIHFDGTCSTVVGLIEAAESIKDVVNPGIPLAARVMAATRAMAELQQTTDFKELVDSGRIDKLLKITSLNTSPLVVSMAGKSPAQGLQEGIAAAQGAKIAVAARINEAAAEAGKAYTDAQTKLSEDKRNKTVTFATIESQFKISTTFAFTSSFSLDACIEALKQPSAEYGSATFALLTVPSGGNEQFKAQEALETATAKLNAAIKRVELLRTSAFEQINDTLAVWRPTLQADKFVSLTELPSSKLKAEQSSLATLCK